MGNIHVANGSRKNLRIIITHECLTVPAIEETGKLGTEPFRLAETSKKALDSALDALGFAVVGPGEALPYHLSVADSDFFVTIVTADEASPIVLCYNGMPPPATSLIITDKGQIQLSRHCGKLWKTEEGVAYEHIRIKEDGSEDLYDLPTHHNLCIGKPFKLCSQLDENGNEFADEDEEKKKNPDAETAAVNDGAKKSGSKDSAKKGSRGSQKSSSDSLKKTGSGSIKKSGSGGAVKTSSGNMKKISNEEIKEEPEGGQDTARQSGAQEARASGALEARQSGAPEARQSGAPEARQSGAPEASQSGAPEAGQPGAPDESANVENETDENPLDPHMTDQDIEAALQDDQTENSELTVIPE